MVHRTRTGSDRIRDLAVKAADIAVDAVITTKIPDKALTPAKGSPKFVTTSLIGSALSQGGSVKLPGYFTYSPTYSTAKGATASPKDDWAESYKGVRVSKSLAGSCYVTGGSTGGYAMVTAVGDV